MLALPLNILLRIFSICLIAGSCFNSFSQQAKFDSLKKTLNSISSPQQKAKLLVDIANSIYASIPDSSICYCEQSENLSKSNHLDEEQARAIYCECKYYLLKGDIKVTIEKLNVAINLYLKTNNQNGLASCYSLKSNALGRIGKSDEELTYLLKAKEIYKKTQSLNGLENTLNDLANVYCYRGQYQNALNALKEISELNLPKNESNFFTELNYGLIYLKQKKYIDATIHLKNAIDIANHYNMLDSEITALTYLAESQLELNNLNEAQTYFNKAILLATKNHLLVEEKDALEGVINLFEKKKSYYEAFTALKRFKELNDTLFNIEKIKSINEIENRLKLSEKEKIIAKQNLSIETSKLETANYKNNLLIVGAILCIAILGFLSLFYYNRKTKRLYSLIQKQKLEVEKQKEIIEVKNKDVMDSIHYAKYIQGSMLPSLKNINSKFKESFVFYKPKDVVAGDFYWAEKIGSNNAFAVCDCTGHGVPGAMVSVVACNALNRAINEFKLTNPALIFDKVNELMQETFSKSDYEVNDGMDGVLCIVDYDTMKLHIAAANNPVWLVTPPSITTKLWEQPWELSQIAADKKPIGRYAETSENFSLKTISFEKGEMLYLFTDGFADQFGGPKGKKFKYKQLQELFTSIAKLPSVEQHNAINQTLMNWQGSLEQVDDILIVGIRL